MYFRCGWNFAQKDMKGWSFEWSLDELTQKLSDPVQNCTISRTNSLHLNSKILGQFDSGKLKKPTNEV